MNEKQLLLAKEYERLDLDTINLLFSSIFPYLSNLVIFNLAFFCVGGRTKADFQIRKALSLEAFRRGLVKCPNMNLGQNVKEYKFTEKEIKSIGLLFACDREDKTTEDVYVELVTGRDRWAERYTPKLEQQRAAKKARRHK